MIYRFRCGFKTARRRYRYAPLIRQFEWPTSRAKYFSVNEIRPKCDRLSINSNKTFGILSFIANVRDGRRIRVSIVDGMKINKSFRIRITHFDVIVAVVYVSTRYDPNGLEGFTRINEFPIRFYYTDWLNIFCVGRPASRIHASTIITIVINSFRCVILPYG